MRQAKFGVRAEADMTKLDHEARVLARWMSREEMELFPFKKASVRVMRDGDVRRSALGWSWLLRS